MTIPEELSDAARVDGASEWQIMTRVIVPLAKPAIAAVALFNFLYAGTTSSLRCCSSATTRSSTRWRSGWRSSSSATTVQWNLTMAASTLMMLPIIVLFFLAQKVFVEGVTLTGVKG